VRDGALPYVCNSAGCIWVIRICKPEMDPASVNSENFCYRSVDIFAFWLITTLTSSSDYSPPASAASASSPSSSSGSSEITWLKRWLAKCGPNSDGFYSKIIDPNLQPRGANRLICYHEQSSFQWCQVWLNKDKTWCSRNLMQASKFKL